MQRRMFKSSQLKHHYCHSQSKKQTSFFKASATKTSESSQLANYTLHLKRSGMLLAFTKAAKKFKKSNSPLFREYYERHDQSGSSSRSD